MGQQSPCAAATEAHSPRACAVRQEKPPQQEAYVPQIQSTPDSLQLEKSHEQQWRPSMAKTKQIIFLIQFITWSLKKKKIRQDVMTLHCSSFWPPDLFLFHSSNNISVHCSPISFLMTPWWISHEKISWDSLMSTSFLLKNTVCPSCVWGINAATCPHPYISHLGSPSGISTVTSGLLRTATRRLSRMQMPPHWQIP